MMKGMVATGPGLGFLPVSFFSYDEDCHYKWRSENPSREGPSNDAISSAFNQISKSPFTRRIEEGKLP